MRHYESLGLLPPVAREGQAHLAMDEATRASLEVLVSSQGTRRGSLIEAVDRCVTGAGARQLADDLSAPLTDAAATERVAVPLRRLLHFLGSAHESAQDLTDAASAACDDIDTKGV